MTDRTNKQSKDSRLSILFGCACNVCKFLYETSEELRAFYSRQSPAYKTRFKNTPAGLSSRNRPTDDDDDASPSRQKRKTLKHPRAVPNFLRVSRNIRRPVHLFQELASMDSHFLHWLCAAFCMRRDTVRAGFVGWLVCSSFRFHVARTKVNININSTSSLRSPLARSALKGN